MRRAVHLLLVLALVTGQAAAQLHALSHAVHDLRETGLQSEGPTPLDHSIERCVLFKALGSGMPGASPVHLDADAPVSLETLCAGQVAATPHLAFDSRAPPKLP